MLVVETVMFLLYRNILLLINVLFMVHHWYRREITDVLSVILMFLSSFSSRLFSSHISSDLRSLHKRNPFLRHYDLCKHRTLPSYYLCHNNKEFFSISHGLLRVLSPCGCPPPPPATPYPLPFAICPGIRVGATIILTLRVSIFDGKVIGNCGRDV